MRQVTVAAICIAIFIKTASANVENGEKIDLGLQPSDNSTSSRAAKFLSLFTIVRFANSLCFGSNGFNGTCLTNAECAQNGGTGSGTCAAGFGVCCTIFVSTCGSTITRNNTYWINPGYPISKYSASGQCSVYVQKLNPDICQLRLDFINFQIGNPSQTPLTATQCLTDLFSVSGASNNIPGICGNNTGQHMYLDMTPGTNLFTLNMILSGSSNATSRCWNIRISQIPCGSTYKAPDGCLQWFTDATATFSSFNYQFSSTPAVQHLSNQDYTICIRMNQGFCGICYKVCDTPSSVLMPFQMSDLFVSQTDASCNTDWIQIPCATDQQSTSQLLSDGITSCVNKLCGSYFNAVTASTVNAPVYSYRKPFEVRVFTDISDPTSLGGLGFCLKYTQQPCTTNNG